MAKNKYYIIIVIAIILALVAGYFLLGSVSKGDKLDIGADAITVNYDDSGTNPVGAIELTETITENRHVLSSNDEGYYYHNTGKTASMKIEGYVNYPGISFSVNGTNDDKSSFDEVFLNLSDDGSKNSYLGEDLYLVFYNANGDMLFAKKLDRTNYDLSKSGAGYTIRCWGNIDDVSLDMLGDTYNAEFVIVFEHDNKTFAVHMPANLKENDILHQVNATK